ncbi:MAG TPA: cation-translocating P-type ATPase [Steroidobacteraceae bacterium]|nr:cation-translocating P-type ATPase [Steroidobacteraceae bacterium]
MFSVVDRPPVPLTDPAAAWHASPAQQALERLGSGPRGLTAAEAAARLARDGPNALAEGASRGPLRIFFAQFADFMIGVLLVAAGVAFVIGEAIEAGAILAIVVLNAVLGFVQEWRAEQAIAALRSLAAPHAHVLRAGVRTELPAADLVVGDVVWLEAGARVPADLRLIDSAALRIDEAALTGESVPVDKEAQLTFEPDTVLADRQNMAWSGTSVTGGRAHGLVVAIGRATQLGNIARLVEQAGETRTPLQDRLARFGRRLALAVLAICAVIFAAGLARGEPAALMFLTAISLAVAAIPEALPAVVSIALAFGARRMSRANALVRRLPCVESLGSVTVICTDKTGTLTENRLELARFEVTRDATRDHTLEVLALNSDAARAEAGHWLGDPTEIALVDHAHASGIDVEALREALPRIAELPFDSERKRMTTVHTQDDRVLVTVKGAPEAVLPICVGLDTAEWHRRADAMAADGLRVLAIAARGADPHLPIEDLERDLHLLALVGLIDPPRPEAQAAVAECLAAGIRPVMITGDHPSTALAIARALGIAEDAASVVTGAELERMDDTTLAARLADARVFARVDPAQKIRIVRALQARNESVAMTGDGVNDAPALKQSDVGVSMGRGGTDVARDASDLVLLDDNFATIVDAVREGRRIYDNIRKFVRFVMAGNAGEIWTIFLAPFLGLPIPLTPIQILWVNFITDGLPGLALTSEPAERHVMRRRPRPRSESVFAHGIWQHILWAGLLIGIVSLAACAWAIAHGEHPQTMAFTVLTFAQLAHVMAIRSETDSLWRLGLLSNRFMLLTVAASVALHLAIVYLPLLQPVFGTEPLSARAMLVATALSLAVLLGVEIEKWAARRGWLYDLRTTEPRVS